MHQTGRVDYLSLITDGMAQSHCMLPWFGNVDSWNNSCLTQHLQGILIHGRKMKIFRTFHNIILDSNLAIHSLLLSLEHIIKTEGKLPETLYFQVSRIIL